MPSTYLQLHEELIAEFKNETVWPKHALVVYQWREEARIDVAAGLLCALLLGVQFSCPSDSRSP